MEDLQALEGEVLMGAGIGIFPTRIGRDYDNVIQGFELRPEVRAFTAFFVPRYRALFQDN